MINALELLKRYNAPATRYTSYPPAPHWQGANSGLLLSALRRSTSPLSIYVHIPFCERLCLYCGCNVAVKKDHDNGSLYRNFQGYSTHGETDLLGFGVSAISHAGRTFTQNHRESAVWEDDIDAARLPVARGYVQTKDDSIRSVVIEDCLCSGRISKDAVEKSFSIRFDEYFMPELMRLNELERDALIEGRTSRTISITPAGRLFIRAVANVFDTFQPSTVASKAV